ncbi:MAG: response regulator, partial [Oscillospiraceae bacterium]|nr:response regulator [Oscillospiraceae bacterium]
MSVNVLVVDDSKVERNYLAGLLKRLGATPDIAESSDEGVFKACKQEYDLIFIDYFMPDADGVHALKEIRTILDSRNASTPAIALGTADPVLGDDFFIMQGFINYLEKPVDHELLHAALLLYLPEMKRVEIGAAEEGPAGASMIPEWLKGIEELNIKEGIKNCGTDDGFMSALEIFYNSIDNMSHEIQSYYSSENWTDYTIKVHALKSSARIIGLADLSELAKKLEAAGDGGDLDFINAETDHLLT